VKKLLGLARLKALQIPIGAARGRLNLLGFAQAKLLGHIRDWRDYAHIKMEQKCASFSAYGTLRYSCVFQFIRFLSVGIPLNG
jgi:hypothetical protein